MRLAHTKVTASPAIGRSRTMTRCRPCPTARVPHALTTHHHSGGLDRQPPLLAVMDLGTHHEAVASYQRRHIASRSVGLNWLRWPWAVSGTC